MHYQFTRSPNRRQQVSSVNSQEIHTPPGTIVQPAQGGLFTDDVLVDLSTHQKKVSKGHPPGRMYELANQLRSAIETTSFHHPFSRTHWAKEFEQLVGTVGEATVLPVLNWFCQHIREQYTPRIRSASAFRKRFGDLQEAMQRGEAKRPEKQVELSPESRWVLNRLRQMTWRKGSDQQLAAVVELSCQNLKAWVIRMRRAKLPVKLEDSRRRLLNLIGDVEYYLERWFTEVWERYRNWDEWSGDLGGCVWTSYHQWFIAAAQDVIGDLDTINREVKDGAPG